MTEKVQHQREGRHVRVIGGQTIVLDKGGFLADPTQWTEEVAQVLAEEAGLATLTDQHLQILRFINRYYAEQGKAPQNHKLKVASGMTLSEIRGMFPGGIYQGAHRLAGLPRRKGCSG